MAPPPVQGNLFEVTRLLQLQGYRASLMFAPVADMVNHSGTTWIELFALFLLRGGCIAPEQVSQSTQDRPRFTYMFKLFVELGKSLLQYANDSSK